MGIKKVYQQPGDLTRRRAIHPLGTLRRVLLATILLAVPVPAAWAQVSGRITGKITSTAGKSRIDVSLVEDIKALGEVVVVGYGEMKRSDVSGAQTSITSKEIERTVNTTIEQAIQGRAAGVYVTQNTGQPGGGVSVNIRGINSITGSNEPLYVIDGVQLQLATVGYGASSSTNEGYGWVNHCTVSYGEMRTGRRCRSVPERPANI